MANQPQQPKKPDEENKGEKKSNTASDLADPTFAPGQQTVDPKKDQVLPETKPGEAAPLEPQGDGGEKKQPEPSSSGYRVAEGRSVTTKIGLLNSDDEIKPEHVGGQERLDELEKSGLVVKTGGGSSTGEKKSGDKAPAGPSGSGYGSTQP